MATTQATDQDAYEECGRRSPHKVGLSQEKGSSAEEVTHYMVNIGGVPSSSPLDVGEAGRTFLSYRRVSEGMQ